MWNILHASVCSKYSILSLSLKNNLKKGTLQIIYLFSKYNKKGALQSSLQKNYYNIALTSKEQTMIFWLVLTHFL